MKETKKSPLLAVLLCMLLSAFPMISYAEETTEKSLLSSSDFESDSFQGWIAFGNKSIISIADETSHSGNQCIKSSSRSSLWSGPLLNISNIVVPGTEISFQAYVRNASDDDMNIIMSTKLIDTKGTESYFNIDTVLTDTQDWCLLEGTYTVPENMSELMVYFQTEDDMGDFYVDDIKIFGDLKETVSVDDNGNENGYQFDFENSLDNWIPRGDISILATKDFSYSGDYSLYVSDRKDFWNAPIVHLDKIKPGVSYNYSAYVMYNGAEYEDNHVFSLKLQYNINGTETYAEIQSKPLHKGTWSKLEGDFTVPKNAEDIALYIQTADVLNSEVDKDDLMSFYIDNIVIFDSTVLNRQKLIHLILALILSAVSLILTGLIAYLIVKKMRKTRAVLLSASMDAMTKTFNRNTYEERMKILETSPEKCARLYITVCDVNFLKYINDNYGHEAGDKAIIRCAEVLLRTIGKKGKVYRTGGDEFMCITKCDLTNDIKTEFSLEAAHYKGYPFSVAVGTAHYDKTIDFDTPDVKAILIRSDKEMYKHKQEIKKFTKEFAHDIK